MLQKLTSCKWLRLSSGMQPLTCQPLAAARRSNLHLIERLEIQAQFPVVDGVILRAVVDVWHLYSNRKRATHGLDRNDRT